MNSSRTWKSGELCVVHGMYRCETCRHEGRETVKEFAVGSVLPMCDACVEKDATWKLSRTMESGAAGE